MSVQLPKSELIKNSKLKTKSKLVYQWVPCEEYPSQYKAQWVEQLEDE